MTLECLTGVAALPCSKVSTVASFAFVSYCRGGIKKEEDRNALTSIAPLTTFARRFAILILVYLW